MNMYLSSQSSKPSICLRHEKKMTMVVPVNEVFLKENSQSTVTQNIFFLIKFNYYNYNLFIDPLIGFANESQNAL